jgi:NNP family nitrate/nitrite transporter-like MFS transporter
VSASKRGGIKIQFSDKECPVPEPFSSKAGTIFFLSGLFLLGFLCRVIFAPLMPTIEQDLGIGHRQAGSLFLMMSMGFFVGQIGSGFVSNRLNHRGALILSALTVGFTPMLFIFADSINGIRLLLIILGLVAGLHVPSALATITAMVSRQDWGKALGVHQTAPSVSLVLAPLLVEAFLGPLTWRMILVCLGFVDLAMALIFILFGRCGDFSGEAPKPTMVKAVMDYPSFWIMIAIFALMMGGAMGTYSMLPLYLISERGLNKGWANSLLGLSRLSGLFITFLSGLVTDRVGEKWSIAVVMILAGCATILLGILSGPWLVVIIFLQPALIACFFPPAFSSLSRITPPNLRSLTTSLVTPTAFLFGGGVAPALLGYMGEVHTFGLGISLAGGLMLIGPFLLKFLTLRDQIEAGC